MAYVLTERLSDPLQYIPEVADTPRKGYLGRLKGVCADWKHGTRNGGRRYPKELWEKVFASDVFKEGMNTLTIYGEVDHPFDERLETSLKEVAVVLTEIQMDEDEGVVIATFDILDTPNGRILKTLCDYGSRLGVSSRGSGEVIQQNGEPVVDPDTYYFVAFDVVVLPSVVKARPEVVESVATPATTKLMESFQKEIESSNDKSHLEIIKYLVESANIPNKESITESIDNKLSHSSEGDNTSSVLLEDLKSSTKRIAELETEIANLKESADTIRDQSEESSQKMIEFLQSRIKRLESLITNRASTIKTLRKSVADLKSENSTLKENLSSTSTKLFNKSVANRMLTEQVDKLSKDNDACSSAVKSANRMIESLRQEVRQKSSEVTKLTESSSSISKTYESKLRQNEAAESRLTTKLSESASKISHLTEVADRYKKGYSSLLTKYVSTYSRLVNLDESVVRSRLGKSFTPSDAQRVIEELITERDNCKMLPFRTEETSRSGGTVIVESAPLMSDEDLQTMSILTNFSKGDN